jgi:hypothetical protein
MNSGSRTDHGPLPERARNVLSRTISGDFTFNQSRPPSSDNDGPIEELINHYAYAFHLKLGGSEGDWNKGRENRVKYEMPRRWREHEY